MPPPPTPTVLVVEDDPGFAATIAEALAGEGVGVRLVASGEEALAAVAAAPPDLVLSDVWLPGGMSGWDLVEALIRHRRPVVLMSGVFLESRSRSFSFVRKQDGVDHIVAAVRAALADAAAREGGSRTLPGDATRWGGDQPPA